MKPFRFTALAVFSLAVSACNCGITVDPEGLLCDEGNTCPSGYVCSAGVCKTQTNVNACTNVTCTTPPGPKCVGAVLQTFNLPGTCAAGNCSYVTKETTCVNGCVDGACVDQDLCGGVSCDSPPPADCQGMQARTFMSPGTCTKGTGQCSYSASTVNCPFGCAGAVCVMRGLSFAQTSPRVKHPINHLDVAPGSNGNWVIAVGPGGQASKWDGQRWSTLATQTTSNLNRVFFRNANSAYIVGANRTFLKVDAAGVTPVTGFPTAPAGNLNLVDVHEGGQRLFVVDDAGAWFMQTSASGTWASGKFSAVGGTYGVNQLYVDSLGNARAVGMNSVSSGGFVGYFAASSSKWFEDVDDQNGGSKNAFVSVGPSYVVDSKNSKVFVGRLGDETVRQHAADMPYFSDAEIPLPSPEPVLGITGNPLAVALNPSVYLLTFSSLFRSTLVGGMNPISHVETLFNFALRASDTVVMSKNEAQGVLVAEVAPQGNNVFRLGPSVQEALDLAADFQAVTTYANGLPLLVTQNNDVAFGVANKATYGFARGPLIQVSDAVGTATGAVIVGAAGLVNRFVASNSTFTGITGATQKLNAICRASDNDMFIVGANGAIYHYTGGATVTAMASGTAQHLNSVDCAGGEVVACGDNGTVLRFTSGMWRSIATGLSGNFDSCRFGTHGTVYAAGNGVFAKFENNTWASLAGDSNVKKLIILGPSEVYAIAGTGKQVKRFNGQSWSTLFTSDVFLAGGGQVGTKVVFVGDSGWVVESQ
ncbi:MAG: hypothetical protein K1X64_00665 [Myxococcaceae bacterium]|nr:hypothetical protein [Myxococcaceae bacterium]